MELSRIKEADGDIASAATILQELQVTNVAVSAYALIQCTLCLCCYELFIWCHVLLYIYVYVFMCNRWRHLAQWRRRRRFSSFWSR